MLSLFLRRWSVRRLSRDVFAGIGLSRGGEISLLIKSGWLIGPYPSGTGDASFHSLSVEKPSQKRVQIAGGVGK